MGKKILVGEAIDEGSKVLTALRRDRVRVRAAFWRQNEDGYWHMIIVTSLVRGRIPIYRKIHNALDRLGARHLTGLDFRLVSPDSHEYEHLWARRPKGKKATTPPAPTPLIWPYEEYFYAV